MDVENKSNNKELVGNDLKSWLLDMIKFIKRGIFLFNIISLPLFFILYLLNIFSWQAFVIVTPVLLIISAILILTMYISPYVINKIDKTGIENGKCVRKTTWIMLCAAAIFDLYMFLEILHNNTLSKFLLLNSSIILFISYNMKEYSKDIKESGGEIYYQGRLMSKWEKYFFNLARRVIIRY